MFDFLKKFFHHEQTSPREKVISGVLAFAYVIGMGTRGQSGIKSAWFQSLIRPEAQPPDWVFPLVWGILFLLLGLAAYYAWNFYTSGLGRKAFAVLYLVNGFLLAIWTHQFFTKQAMGNALYVMIALIITIELMIVVGFYTNKKSAYLLLPYLGWILFATYLNTNYIILNS